MKALLADGSAACRKWTVRGTDGGWTKPEDPSTHPARRLRYSMFHSQSGAPAMSQTFKVKDRVSWNTPQGQTHGHVTRVITKRTELDGHVVAGSAEDPSYEVESEKSGKRAVHKGNALHKTAG
jgi:Hypervirulence associated proteins TUDOR domain